MRIIPKSYFTFEDYNHAQYLKDLSKIERVARTCYQSDYLIKLGSDERMIRKLIEDGHLAMIEHAVITVRFVVDRGLTHEFVRHRLASFAQESTRWCNYSKDRGAFNGELTFVCPRDIPVERQDVLNREYADFLKDCELSEKSYLWYLSQGKAPQYARGALNHWLKSEIVITANYREWRNILELRTASDAHPDMRAIVLELLAELKKIAPAFFDDIGPKE